MEQDPKFSRQLDLEEKMRSMGIDRFWSGVNNAREQQRETRTRSVSRLMDSAIQRMIEGIKAFMSEASSGKAGRKALAVKYLALIEPEVAAYMAVRCVLDSISLRDRFQKTALAISNLIEDELRFRAFKAAQPHLHRKMVQDLKERTPNYHHQRNVMHHSARMRNVAWDEWDLKGKVGLGTKLIELMIETTCLVRKTTTTVAANKTVSYIEATEDTMEWIKSENARCQAMTPLFLPTIVPPKPWTTPFDGGYHTRRISRLTLVKTPNRNYLEDLQHVEMPEVYAAINTMQDTAWAINAPVYNVMAELWANQSTVASIPNVNDLPLPPRPVNVAADLKTADMTEEQKESLRVWKREASQVYEANAKMRSNRLQFAKTLMVAEMFKDEEEFFFPYQMDFRGRVYAVSLFLTPQGGDYCRALLTFANGVPLGDQEGVKWLAVHGANCFGFDKADLDARQRWVGENEPAILSVAADPFENRFWTNAEKPWQFLAFCFEWAGYKAEGVDFVSSLPVQMDGSCNGLQNFSAMLRDEIGAAAVNLVPSEKPADIYQAVADIVIKSVEADAAAGDEIAKGWIGNVTRKVTKRPVMTLAYGAREYGFKQQVFDDTVTPWKTSGEQSSQPFPWDRNGWKAAEYMGKVIWQSVSQVVVAATGAMKWLQEVAKLSTAEGLPVRWTSPAGFVVQQDYRESVTTELQITFLNGRVKLAVDSDGSKIDRRRQQSGISPNFVHSCDAAHMQKTVNRCAEQGIKSFSLVHDSYGTHAGNTWALAYYLREQFVEMYRPNILEAFRSELQGQLGEGVELPPVPPMGSLDLDQVMASPFFFA